MEDFIDYKTALLAKEKGLDLESNYFKEQEEGQPDYDDSCDNWNLYDGYCTIITKNNLQKWLREKHKIHVQIVYERGFWKYVLHKLPSDKDIEFANSGECQDGDLWLDAEIVNNEWYLQESTSYEDALEKGLFHSLQIVSETVA
jgi:hypothetical protein